MKRIDNGIFENILTSLTKNNQNCLRVILCNVSLILYNGGKISLCIKRSNAAENPFGFGYMLNLIYAYLQKPLEITITGTQSRDISSRLAREFLPESILISISDMPTLKPLLEYAFFTGKEFGEKSLAYVCQDSTCSPPVYTAQQVLDLVK